MTSTLTARRTPSVFTPSQHSDEGYLNRSLLDNIDAQGDADPMPSSDSEAAAASAPTTFSSLSTASSMGSPSIPYHLSIQSPLASQRPDSPSHHALTLKSPQHATDLFHQGPQNNTNHPMYNNINSIGLPTSDYSLSSTEPDALNFTSKVNGSFAPAPFKTSTSFTSFPNRSRHPASSYRDTSSAFSPTTYTSTNDLFGAPQNPISHLPPSQSQVTLPHAVESYQPSGRSFDFPPSQLNGSVSTNGMATQQLFGSTDPFRQGPDSTSSLLPKHQGGLSGSQSLLQSGHQSAYQPPYVNGLGIHTLGHGHHSQPQFGAPLPGNSVGPAQSVSQSSGVTSAPHTNGSATASQAQEEISTIFVVGFPDDMSEREFQNMFTFSSGFEAATLKIPNKELTSYGSTGAQTGRPQGLPMPFGGSNDPYNIVTINQGGVLIDGGRDGPMTSWPTSAPNDDGHYMQNNMPMQPPRKQIIGFAKFRTRNEALEARDVLQGRRVDVEKGAVLKAEMAKKNLHTKRGPGVGPLGLPSFPNMMGAAPDNLPGLTGLSTAGEALTQRDKQLGALGAMGIDLSGFPQRRDRSFDGRDDEDRDRRRDLNVGLAAFTTRGPRERAEDDERERERKRREKEKETRLRQNTAFEAFHSVPQQMVRQGANSVRSAENGLANGYSMPSPPSIHSLPSQSDGMTGPWGNIRDVTTSAALRKMGLPQHHLGGLPIRTLSPSATSPSSHEAVVSLSAQASVFQVSGLVARHPQSSPESLPSSLPSHPSLPSRPRAMSPSSEPQPTHEIQVGSSSLPNSTASSVSGSQTGHEDELVRSVGALALSTDSGSTSPQLPSPASGTSSGGCRNGSDQNPPINTLYVGNLPTSMSPGGNTLGYLEDHLRELFSKQPGYRKLCFRQKSNGPMCFVEFENVEYATKALNELYGDTLNGLVRNGGIRLSYSKNPLGVRTPNSGGNGPSLQQQQQQHTLRDLQDGVLVIDTYQRHADSVDTIRAVRRDTSGMTSPTSSYHYTASPPPPRFFSPPPPGTFGGSLATSTSFPRANPQGFSFAPGSTNFSPFSIPHSHSSIPDQPVADASNDHLAHPLTPVATNIEASRAG